jgi:c-di-GMP-related signal transduction protein
MREFFVSMDLLRKPLLVGVEMRGPLFDELTLALDQIMLRAFKRLDAMGTCSININVETVFTKAFQIFLEETPEDRFSRIVFEFRQPNIVEKYDEFLVARSMISSKGAQIAVDRIFPDTVGLINLDYVGATLAKVHWRTDAEEALKERQRALRYITECGVKPVLVRVDDPRALEIGANHGFTMFQGFLIDDMMRQAA